jgi:putative hydrolase of the HAD superfamily
VIDQHGLEARVTVNASSLMPDVHLIVFDLGRVLIRICDSWEHACEVARLPVKLPQRDEAMRAALLDAVIAMETGRIDTPEFCRRAAKVFSVEPSHIESILDCYLIGAYPGVDELLAQLSSNGVVTACLSNTQAEHWMQMFDPRHRAALPMHRLKHRFASHLLGMRKPEDAIYAHVERATGFAGPAVVFFDDMVENVEAAAKRGWRAFHIQRERDDPVAQMRENLKILGVLRAL